MAYLSYIHLVKPHDESSFNRLELCNEYALCLLAYCMLFFTGGGTGSKVEYGIGRSMALVLILLLFLVNLSTMLRNMYVKAKLKIKHSSKCLWLKKHCESQAAK